MRHPPRLEPNSFIFLLRAGHRPPRLSLVDTPQPHPRLRAPIPCSNCVLFIMTTANLCRSSNLPQSRSLSGDPVPPSHLEAYKKILRAEKSASQRNNIDQVIHARVVGYLFVEFSKRTSTYGSEPCNKIVEGISVKSKKPTSAHDVVFKL